MRGRSLSWILFGIPVIALLIYGIGRWLDVSRKYMPQVPFNSRRWLSYTNEAVASRVRQQMVRDLVINVLPHKSRSEILGLLGDSPSHEQMRRHSERDFDVKVSDTNGDYLPYPRTGIGYYFDNLEWDLIYEIGYEQIVVRDHKGQLLSPDPEFLVIRLDTNGVFESWFVEGSTAWPKVVKNQTALQCFGPQRSPDEHQLTDPQH